MAMVLSVQTGPVNNYQDCEDPSPPPPGEETGLKLLHDGLAPEVDIIAVHGLGGHRENSWTAANGVNWLHGLLPGDMPNIRVLSWGYSLATVKNSHETMSEQKISEQLVRDLWELRSSTNRIVVDHHQALLYADSAQETPTADLRRISLSTRGAIFMGTPELDSRLVGLQSYLASAKGSEQESSDIYKEAHWLMTILESYPSISQHIWTLFVHERLNSPSRNTPLGQTASSPQDKSSHIFVQADHSGMVKFEASLDEGYLQIKEHLVYVEKILKQSTTSE
ncbi:uncharacterized protein N7479_005817 [Penicillium vulpinum]|uniref:uncharacterized protein n=1 Tax=Penicillium vulpinum TaxID=29845 RepID=UPI0025494AEE|nr:uncharacterized protein N7479_005817 [Penicillium vulpinum]KAJ5958667.1 hypothetical protein N7479_005817 [Penicillium vulpinum]